MKTLKTNFVLIAFICLITLTFTNCSKDTIGEDLVEEQVFDQEEVIEKNRRRKAKKKKKRKKGNKGRKKTTVPVMPYDGSISIAFDGWQATVNVPKKWNGVRKVQLWVGNQKISTQYNGIDEENNIKYIWGKRGTRYAGEIRYKLSRLPKAGKHPLIAYVYFKNGYQRYGYTLIK